MKESTSTLLWFLVIVASAVVFFGVMIAQSAGLLFHNDYEMLPVLGGIMGAQLGMYVYIRRHGK